MLRGSLRSNGTRRKDRKIKEDRAAILSRTKKYITPPLRDENYAKMLLGLESLKITIPNDNCKSPKDKLLDFINQELGSLEVLRLNFQKSLKNLLKY